MSYGKLRLGELLADMKAEAQQSLKGQDIIVLIKLSPAAVARNLVDVLDAVQRASIERFMITKLDDLEKDMM